MANAWDDFVSLVAVDVPGCPPLSIREALKHSVDSFCERTGYWATTLDPISLVSGLRDYDLVPPLDSRIITILSASYNGLKLSPYTDTDLDFGVSGWTVAPQGMPLSYQLVQDDDAQMLRLYPTPANDEDDVLTVRGSLKPTSDAGTFPAWFFEDWRSALASGALSQLCAVPGKTWSNSELAVYHGGLFNQAVTKAVARLATGGTNKTLTARPVRFG